MSKLDFHHEKKYFYLKVKRQLTLQLNSIMKILSIALAITALITTSSHAQMYLQDVVGNPIVEKKSIDVIGTPFLDNEFLIGKVVLSDGRLYENIPLKYSTFEDELFFKNPKDNGLLSFVVPVKEFELSGIKYVRGLPAVDNFTEKSFYGLIANGKIKLLLKNYKSIMEIKPYNAVAVEKRFEDMKSYYILKDGKMNRFKPSKKDFLILFQDKSSEIDAFLKKEKIDFKNNVDLVKVFDYYDKL
jgi:hypothetical protein